MITGGASSSRLGLGGEGVEGRGWRGRREGGEGRGRREGGGEEREGEREGSKSGWDYIMNYISVENSRITSCCFTSVLEGSNELA